MVLALRLAYRTWGGFALTATVCAVVDLLSAAGVLPVVGAVEIIVVAVTLQLARWHTSERDHRRRA